MRLERKTSKAADPNEMIERPGQSPIKRSALEKHEAMLRRKAASARGERVTLGGYPVDICSDRRSIFDRSNGF